MTPSIDNTPDQESKFQSNIVMLFGALFFAVGTALNVEMVVTQSWPTSLYFMLMGLGVVVFLLGLWSRRSWITRDTPRGFIKRNIAFFVLPGAFILFLAYQFGTGVQSVVEEKMTWGYGIATDDTTQTHTIFRFVDYPEYVIGVYSSDLAEKLETVGQDIVDVKIIVTTDFGVMRGFQIAQIGPITQWKGTNSYSSGTDANKAPPWMH